MRLCEQTTCGLGRDRESSNKVQGRCASEVPADHFAAQPAAGAVAQVGRQPLGGRSSLSKDSQKQRLHAAFLKTKR